MYKVHIHLTTGEKLKPFGAREFDIDLGKQTESGAQRYTYLDPKGEESIIYLNPKGVAAIELRPSKASPRHDTQELAADDQVQSQQGSGSNRRVFGHDQEEVGSGAEELGGEPD